MKKTENQCAFLSFFLGFNLLKIINVGIFFKSATLVIKKKEQNRYNTLKKYQIIKTLGLT